MVMINTERPVFTKKPTYTPNPSPAAPWWKATYKSHSHVIANGFAKLVTAYYEFQRSAGIEAVGGDEQGHERLWNCNLVHVRHVSITRVR